MKKHIAIFSTLAFAAGLTAFGFIKDSNLNHQVNESQCATTEAQENPANNISDHTVLATSSQIVQFYTPEKLSDFFYDFGPRFNPITKENLSKAKRVSDFIDKNEMKQYEGVGSTTLIIIEHDIQTDKRVYGKGEKLSEEQLRMIESMEYSSNFLLRAELKTSELQAISKGENVYYPHHTIVPETQATYEGGKDALLDHLRQNNEKNIYNLDESKLQPAKLSFTVTKIGTIEKAELDRTSGYSNIDEEMLRLVKNLPGKWRPAENAKGEKVDQVLVISFGMVGC